MFFLFLSCIWPLVSLAGYGLVASLGFGVQQVASGLSFVLGIDNGLVTQVSLIAGITLVATVSVVSGIQKGVKFLSEMNMRIAVGG